MQCHDVALTLIQGSFKVVCQLVYIMLLQLCLALIHVQNGHIAPVPERSVFNRAIVLLSSETMLFYGMNGRGD